MKLLKVLLSTILILAIFTSCSSQSTDEMISKAEYDEQVAILNNRIAELESELATLQSIIDNNGSGSVEPLDFLVSIKSESGVVEVTSNLRQQFNVFARDYRMSALPTMDGYESFFNYESGQEYSNFALAVFYALRYNDYQDISKDDMQALLIDLFAAEGEYEPMIHENYFKIAKYVDGVYSPWPEGAKDPDREFYYLASLNSEQSGDTVRVNATFLNYYFNDTSIYEPGANEIVLANKVAELGCSDLEAAAILMANGEISELTSQSSFEVEMIVDPTKSPTESGFFKFAKVIEK